MSRVLVTGGCGFIGSHIVDTLLKNQYQVAVFDNLSTGSIQNINKDKAEFFFGDILSKDLETAVALFKPEYIIHEAAQTSVNRSINNIHFDAELNIMGTINIINICIKYSIKKVIFASSAAVYGNSKQIPVPVNSAILPNSPYGLSKYTAEEYLKLAKDLYGIDYTILRYSNVYGPRQNALGEGGVISIFLNNLISNLRQKIYGDGNQTRDFIFVKDVSYANLKALEVDECGVFNISTSTSTSINQLFNIINGLSSHIFPPIYEPARDGDIRESQLCNKESMKCLNWKPLYSLEEGLELTYRYLCEQNNSLKVF
nr:NAD-dependent epimerase/dehydratase family protein [Neobacillus sp. Marseille-Q6967]